MHDVAIVGGGPAGLSAALMLGRCRRSVVLFDADAPRNAPSRALHGYLTRDGVAPAELRAIGREELARYETVRVRRAIVARARCDDGWFELELAGSEVLAAKKLVLATGVVDALPPLSGLAEFYGRTVFHCPYCDAWEHRGARLAAYGRGRVACGLALDLKTWSDDVIVLSDGPAQLDPAEIDALARAGIRVEERPIVGLEGANGVLARVVLADGERVPCDAIVLGSRCYQASPLAAMLGCEFTSKGAVETGDHERTRVPGLYVVGDASGGEQLAILAAGDGVRAALAIHHELQDEERAAAGIAILHGGAPIARYAWSSRA